MALSAPGARGAHRSCRSTVSAVRHEGGGERPSQAGQMVTPSIAELSSVRTNILCTVEGCAKVLPNSPALRMHLVKSHGLKEGLVNATLGKDGGASRKRYCCPVEGCPRGSDRPFSQFSLVKQHFMKMHVEKKHRCTKCGNCYSTEGDLKRHSNDCGKVYRCDCGCPYASRAALLSHSYRTGHEVPVELRCLPVKKRKMEGSPSGSHIAPRKENYSMNVEKDCCEKTVSGDELRSSDLGRWNQTSSLTKNLHKLLLPKPDFALINIPMMQFAQVPVLFALPENRIPQPTVTGPNHHGSLAFGVQLFPQPMGTVPAVLGMKTKDAGDITSSKSDLHSLSFNLQVSVEGSAPNSSFTCDVGPRSRSTTGNSQMGMFVFEGLWPTSSSELSVSSSSHTDIGISTPVLLPIGVNSQTFFSESKTVCSTAVQTDASCHWYFSSCSVSRETKTDVSVGVSEGETEMDTFLGKDFLSVSTQTSFEEKLLEPVPVEDVPSNSGLNCSKSLEMMGFRAQNGGIHPSLLADSEAQSMTVFSELENILCENVAGSALETHSILPDAPVSSDAGRNTAIEFDIEEFFSCATIQTHTDTNDLCPLILDIPLESLNTETQTDGLFPESPSQTLSSKAHSDPLGLETFDTQTQTDLNFLLDINNHSSLFLKETGFSVSTETFDSETQTDAALSSQPRAPVSPFHLSNTHMQTAASSADGPPAPLDCPHQLHCFLTSS
ncbi:ATM interactor-like [Scleropages formosus]|nr:ATM interactor-like [Scleropages formosus]